MESPTSASLSCDSGSSIIDRDDGSRLENSQVDSPSASSELNDRSPHVQELSNTATGSEHSKTALTIVNDEDGINANNRHLQPTNSDEGVTNKNVNGALHDGVALTDNVKKDEANVNCKVYLCFYVF
jgi:hypothetical protein